MQIKIHLFFITIFTLFIYSVSAQQIPAKPNTLVNDYTQTLKTNELSLLENKLVAFNDSTSTQIAVVLIQSLEGYDISDYAVTLFRAWGIGGKDKDNGILLLISKGDRKVWITTGYGVEGALPDAIAKRIVEQEIKPSFKEGNFYEGIDKGTDAIISYTKGEYKNDQPKKTKSDKGFPGGLLILIIILIIYFISRGGGGGGGGRNVIGRRGGANIFWWSLLSGLANSGSSRGSSGGFGGFSGGGGFGGFGGGSTGGGGAGGSW